MKFCFSLFLIITSAQLYMGQTRLTGTVTDISSNPLPGANVYIKDTYDGASSDKNGKFVFITDEEGEALLVVSFIGYKQSEQKINLTGSEINLVIALDEEVKETDQVVISAGSFEASDENKAVILRPLDIVTTGSEADIYSALETLPGTQQVGESEGLFVRGGSASESKTVVDEMVVQNPFYSSVPDIPSRSRFSPFLFKGIVFSTGGYSAQYGQALSSVLILKTQDLPPDTRSAINIMPLGFGGAHVQRWENSSLGVEAGYFNLGPYFKVLKQRLDWNKAPESFEGSANFRYKTSSTGILKVYSSFGASELSLNTPNLDDLSKKDSFRMLSNNFFFNTNYREIIGEEWTLFSGYSFSIDHDKILPNSDAINQDELLNTGKLTISRKIFGSSFITFGTEVQNIIYKDKFNSFDAKLNELYTAGYVESDLFFTNNFAARIGIRGEHSKTLNKNNLAPRVSLAYKLGTYDQLNFAYGHFYQTPSKDYLMFTNNFDFEKAEHYIINYQYIGLRRTFRIEAYYKDYKDLVKGTVYTYPYFNLPLVPFNNSGKGYAKGLDIFWRDQETFAYTDYWISYSWLDTKRDFRNYPTMAFPTFAAPHTFSVVAKHWFPSITTSVGLTYSFATGRPYFNPNNPVFLGDKGKNYQNLSLNASFLTNIYNNFTVIFFSIDNIYSYENVFGYRYSSDGATSRPVLSPVLRSVFIGMFISIGPNIQF